MIVTGPYVLDRQHGWIEIHAAWAITGDTTTTAPSPTTSSPPPVAPAPTATTAPPKAANCDPSYPDVCIPPPPPDLNCKDIPYRRFKVLPPDPHHFDADHDGVGCER